MSPKVSTNILGTTWPSVAARIVFQSDPLPSTAMLLSFRDSSWTASRNFSTLGEQAQKEEDFPQDSF
jgi:hypothetical protein